MSPHISNSFELDTFFFYFKRKFLKVFGIVQLKIFQQN